MIEVQVAVVSVVTDIFVAIVSGDTDNGTGHKIILCNIHHQILYKETVNLCSSEIKKITTHDIKYSSNTHDQLAYCPFPSVGFCLVDWL